MIVVDWRTRPAADLATCYASAHANWAERYCWDTTPNWVDVETGRASGRLPGYLALAHGRQPSGWCFYLRHRSSLQIGGLTGESSAVAALLLDRILCSPEAVDADRTMAFVPAEPPFITDVFASRGFSVRRFAYLVCGLEDIDVDEEKGCRSYHAGRLPAVADLLARAYPGADPARPFAPGGTPDEWLEYTVRLTATTGCGSLLPWASVVAEHEDPARGLLGGVLSTALAPDIGHIAQVAVDPSSHGQGSGRRLLRTALARLRARGYTHATLLVAEDNRRALDWYARLGFEPRSAFLSATAPR